MARVLLKIQELPSPIPPRRASSLYGRRNHNLDVIYVKQNLNNLSLTELLELYKAGILDATLVQVCQNSEIASMVIDTPYLRNRLPTSELQIRRPTAMQRILGIGCGLVSWAAVTGTIYGAIYINLLITAALLSTIGAAWPFYALVATVAAAWYLVDCFKFLYFACKPMHQDFDTTGGDVNMGLQERRQYCLKQLFFHSIGLPFKLVQTFVVNPLYEFCRYISYGYQAGINNFLSLFSVFKMPIKLKIRSKHGYY